MNPFKASDDRSKRRNSYNNIDEDILEKFYEEIQRMFDSTDFKDMIEVMFRGGFDPNSRFILDYKMETDVIGKPKARYYGNFPKNPLTRDQTFSNEQELPVDVIEGEDTVSITVEIPGAEKDDIETTVAEKILKINVNSPKYKYHKLINLPCHVKEKSIKTTYKNGIFDVSIKRKKKRNKKGGHRVDIE